MISDLKDLVRFSGGEVNEVFVWLFGHKTYATDGRIAIILTAKIPNAPTPDARFGKWTRNINRWLHDEYGPPTKLPAFQRPPKKGTYIQSEAVRVGRNMFASFYLQQIVSLGADELRLGGPDGRALFRFDGGAGLLMPMLCREGTQTKLPRRRTPPGAAKEAA